MYIINIKLAYFKVNCKSKVINFNFLLIKMELVNCQHSDYFLLLIFMYDNISVYIKNFRN